MMSFARTDTSLLSRWWWTVDKWSLGMLLLLSGIGMILTMAASPAVAERLDVDSFHFFRRQAFYIPVAIAVMIGTSLLSPRGVIRLATVGFAIFLILTVATLFVGTEIKGARRWLHLGALSLQPSEFLKPAFVIVCAVLMAKSRQNEGFIGYLLAFCGLVAIGALLALQPDIGTTILVTGAWAVQVFLVGCPLILCAFLGLLCCSGAVMAYFVFDHVRERVDHFLDPNSASGSDGYQVQKAMEAFHAGGWFGRGPGEGRVKEVLPDAHADFIFAVVGEEFGAVVCILLIGLFTLVVLRGLLRAFKDDDLFVVLAVGALVALFGAQALMNMASTMHLIPPKGTTLPLVSYGGSATIALAWSMGMVLALTRERPSWGGWR